MQARLEDVLDPPVAQSRMQLAGEAVALAALAAIGLGQQIEILGDLVVAAEQRARHLRPQDQSSATSQGFSRS